jgi:hypothetical protein
VWETTSGLPDDSREADERLAKRRLRDLRGRVKVARALVANTPGFAEMLHRDWRKAVRFYARFAITDAIFRHGVASGGVVETGVERTFMAWAGDIAGPVESGHSDSLAEE